MKILIPTDNVLNGYIPSLAEAYKRNGCEVVIGGANFFCSNISFDIIHLQWPESLYLHVDYSIYGDKLENEIQNKFEFFKSNNVKLIWTIHNVAPHESNNRLLDNNIYNLFADYADLIVHHGPKSIEIIKEYYPQLAYKRHIVCPHGDYLIQYSKIDKKEARIDLKLPLQPIIMLNFGLIRPYKGYYNVNKVFNNWKEKNKFLFTAGMVHGKLNCYSIILRFWKGKIRNRTRKYGYDIKKIPNSLIATYFSAVDIVFLSHTCGLNSGIIPMAITFNKPVVYPKIGNFESQASGWISESYDAGDIKSASTALNRITERIKSNEIIDNTGWLKNNSWDLHVSIILKEIKLLF